MHLEVRQLVSMMTSPIHCLEDLKDYRQTLYEKENDDRVCRNPVSDKSDHRCPQPRIASPLHRDCLDSVAYNMFSHLGSLIIIRRLKHLY